MKRPPMTDDTPAEDVTILSKEFTPAALEFHRRQMGEKGYIVDGPIVAHQFLILEGLGEPTPLLDGDAYFAVTFKLKPA